MTTDHHRYLWTGATSGGRVRVVASSAAAGDFNLSYVPHDRIVERCRAIVDLPWCLADEHHGCEVVEVDGAQWSIGQPGDIVATSAAGVVVAVWVGDCAPVVFIGADGRIAAAHAGWRGLATGALDAAYEAVVSGPAVRTGRAPGPAPVVDGGVRVVIGACIGPCCYEFGPEDLERVAAGLGVDQALIRSRDRHGRPALDLRASISAWCARVGVDVVAVDPRCTGCDDGLYSYRVDRDLRRQVVGVWREPAGE